MGVSVSESGERTTWPSACPPCSGPGRGLSPGLSRFLSQDPIAGDSHARPRERRGNQGSEQRGHLPDHRSAWRPWAGKGAGTAGLVGTAGPPCGHAGPGARGWSPRRQPPRGRSRPSSGRATCRPPAEAHHRTLSSAWQARPERRLLGGPSASCRASSFPADGQFEGLPSCLHFCALVLSLPG